MDDRHGWLEHRLDSIGEAVLRGVRDLGDSEVVAAMCRDEASERHVVRLVVDMLKETVLGEQEREISKLRVAGAKMEEKELRIEELETRLDRSRKDLAKLMSESRNIDKTTRQLTLPHYHHENYHHHHPQQDQYYYHNSNNNTVEQLKMQATTLTSLLTRFDSNLSMSATIDLLGSVAGKSIEFYIPLFSSIHEVQRLTEARTTVYDYTHKLKVTHKKLKAVLKERDESMLSAGSTGSSEVTALRSTVKSMEGDIDRAGHKVRRAERSAQSWKLKCSDLELEISRVQSEASRRETEQKFQTMLSTHMSDVIKAVNTSTVDNHNQQQQQQQQPNVNAQTSAILTEFQGYLSNTLKEAEPKQPAAPQQPDISEHYVPKAAHLQELQELQAQLLQDTRDWAQQKEQSWKVELKETAAKSEGYKEERDKLALTVVEKNGKIEILEGKVAEVGEARKGVEIQRQRRVVAEQAVAALKAELQKKREPISVPPPPPPPPPLPLPPSELPIIHTQLHDGLAMISSEIQNLDMGRGAEILRGQIEDACRAEVGGGVVDDDSKGVKSKLRTLLKVTSGALQLLKKSSLQRTANLHAVHRKLLQNVNHVRAAAAEVYSVTKSETRQVTADISQLCGLISTEVARRHIVEKNDVTNNIIHTEELLAAKQREHDNLTSKHNAQMSDFTAKHTALTAEHNALKSAYDVLTAQHTTLSTQSDAHLKEIASRDSILKHLSGVVGRYVSGVQHTTLHVLQSGGHSEESYLQALSDVEGRLKELGDRCVEGEEESKLLESGLAEVIEEQKAIIAHLESQVVAAKVDLEEVPVLLQKISSLESSVRTMVDAHQSEKLTLENQLAAVEDQQTHSRQETTQQKSNCATLETRLSELHVEHEQEVSRLQSMHRSTVERLQSEGHLNEKLISQNAEKDKEIARLSLQLSRGS